ncbi:MAG: D-alanine--poly(phosphoribitol) ligase subunit DltC [Firmicutes bacterium]|nr:D-alanine--poly(phosphoribitol) ligase subunit DltC [Bacillota bacterium]
MEEKILEILEEICDDPIVREDKDLDLYDEDLLDSLGFVEMLVTIESELGIVIAPSEVTREDANTANKIIKLVESRA